MVGVAWLLGSTIVVATTVPAPPDVPAGQRVRADEQAQTSENPTIVVTGERGEGAVSEQNSAGLLGNRDRMDTPFSVTTYTDQIVRDLQAKTLGEVLERNPSVTRLTGRFFSNDGFFIRGFPIFGTDLSYDGLYGLTNTRRNSIAAVERINLLKGPSALLNGVPPSGGIGGTVDLVPKRAHSGGNTDLGVAFVSDANFGGSADVGRRFGRADEFGARVNILYRDGDTPLNGNKEREGVGALALDYNKGPLRLFATLNYENLRYDAAVFSGFALAAGVAVPTAPSGKTNVTPPFTYTKTDRRVGAFRAEYDLLPGVTASLGYGFQDVNETQYVTFGSTILNIAGVCASRAIFASA